MFFMSGRSRLGPLRESERAFWAWSCLLGLWHSIRIRPVRTSAVEQWRSFFWLCSFSEMSSASSDSEFSFTWGYTSDSVAEAQIPSLGLSQILKPLNVEFIRRLFVSPRPAQ